MISKSAELGKKLWATGRRGIAKLLADSENQAVTVLQRLHGKPEEDEGVDQGVDAVTPENLRENKPRESGSAHNSDLRVTQQTPHCEGHWQHAARLQE